MKKTSARSLHGGSGRMGMGCGLPPVPQGLVCAAGGKGLWPRKTVAFQNLWTISPLRSFGSNHVALGGMMFPLSAMSMICCMETG